MSVNVPAFVNVSEFGHWVCRHATKDLQPTAPVLKAGHPMSYSVIACSFVSLDGGLSPPFASVLYMYIHNILPHKSL